MSHRLPKGWVRTTLGAIRHDDSFGISQYQMRGEVFELYSVPAFSNGKPFIIPGEEIGSNKAVVSPGDVLLCKINPRINRAWVVEIIILIAKLRLPNGSFFPSKKKSPPDFCAIFSAKILFETILLLTYRVLVVL